VKLWHESAGSGPPVLLLHAGICDARMWEREMGTFSAHHRVTRCDLPGFGRSALVPGRLCHGEEVAALLEGLGSGPADLVGASFGGRVALELAIARPDLVRRLVLIGAPYPDHEWSAAVEAFGEEEERLIEQGRIDDAAELNVRFWVDGPHRSPEDVDPAIRAAVGRMQRRAFELQEPLWEQVEVEALVPDAGQRLGEVRAETLVVTGAGDVGDIHAIAERFAREIPAVRTATIEATAHLPSLERPEEFDELVLGFLGEGGEGPRRPVGSM
jgi:pimeloyl-ACP methyl ester carboxylesterase